MEVVKDDKKRKRTIKLDSDSNTAASDSKFEKKRPKSEKIKSEQKISTAVKLFYAEEEEVEQRDVREDVKLFQGTCEDIQRIINSIKTLKVKQDANAVEIESNRIDGMLQIVMLKKLNRLAHIRCKKVRDGTNEAKMRIDKCHLQQQNLLYEIMHLEKEITKCLEFKSKDEEIDLIPVDQFYNEAPPEISKPEVTRFDDHQQMLARLDYELEQRKVLAKKLQDALQKKESFEDGIKTKQEHLENLQPKLSAILQSTKPVQEYLDMPFDVIREEHMTAQYLPHPLFVLYMQSSSYRDAYDTKLKVAIEGDLDAAKAVDLTAPLILDEDSESDQEEQEDQDKKISKRRRKTVDTRAMESKTKLFVKHPLSVVLHINCQDGNGLQLTFNYLPYLKIITADVSITTNPGIVVDCISGGDLLSADLILSDLFPGDHGNTSPNLSNLYELSRFGLKDFSEYVAQIGRPYLWCQRMGALQYIDLEQSQPPKCFGRAQYMKVTIKRLKKRLQSRLSLLQQLASLERNIVPVSSEYQNMFPVKLSSQLRSWQRSTYEEFLETPYTQAIVDAGLAKPSNFYFTAVIERGTARLTAKIVVAADYPVVAPIFSVNVTWANNRNAQNDIHIKELEEELNIHYEELIHKKSHDQLLTNQLQRLIMCFDVYLECEVETSVREGPAEIAKEKVFGRLTRGRQRSKPYKFSTETGMFTHR